MKGMWSLEVVKDEQMTTTDYDIKNNLCEQKVFKCLVLFF